VARAVSGFWLRVPWLWRDPPPDVEATVREVTTAAHARDLAQHASDAYERELLEQLRRIGKLSNDQTE
jgi:hypothetical protein